MSIAAQLRVLATAERKVDQPKGKPSFLFDSKAAADLDSHTIYNLGCNGLAELIKLNQVFVAFEKTLFGRIPEPSSLINLTAESREKLNKSIACFLRVLSPYFLNKSSHKCLEFLIRCYAIQEHNVEAVLECILPYHETALFARMLIILNLEKVPIWAFLKPAQKNNSPLARSTLVRRCIVDSAVFKFIAEMSQPDIPMAGLRTYLSSLGVSVPNQVNRAAINLYTITVVDVLCTAERVNDDIVAMLIPYLVTGLSASQNPECQTAAYMILTQLSNRVHLRARVLSEILQALCSNIPIDATPQALQFPLLCLIAVFKSQTAVLLSLDEEKISSPVAKDLLTAPIAVFPHNAFSSFSLIQSIPESLRIASDKYDLLPFLWPLLQSLTQSLLIPADSETTDATMVNKRNLNMLLRIISTISTQDKFSTLVLWVLRAFLPLHVRQITLDQEFATKEALYKKSVAEAEEKMLVGSSKKSVISSLVAPIRAESVWTLENSSAISSLMRALDGINSVSMDDALSKIIEASQKTESLSIFGDFTSEETRTGVLGLIGIAFKGTRHEVLSNSDTTLLLSFSHQLPQVRHAAIVHLDNVLFDQVIPSITTSPTTLTMIDDNEEPVSKKITAEDISLDDDLAFLAGPLVSEEMSEFDNPTGSDKTSGESSTGLVVKASITLDDAAALISARLAEDEDASVLQAVLSMRSLASNAVLSNVVLTTSATSLLNRCFAMIGIQCSDTFVSRDLTERSLEKENDVTSIHSPSGACSIIVSALQLLSTVVARVAQQMAVDALSSLSTNANASQTLIDSVIPYFFEALVARNPVDNRAVSLGTSNNAISSLATIRSQVLEIAIKLGTAVSTFPVAARSKSKITKGVAAISGVATIPLFSALSEVSAVIGSDDSNAINMALANAISKSLISMPQTLLPLYTRILIAPYGALHDAKFISGTQQFAVLVMLSVFRQLATEVSRKATSTVTKQNESLLKIVLTRAFIVVASTVSKVATPESISTAAKPTVVGSITGTISSLFASLDVVLTALLSTLAKPVVSKADKPDYLLWSYAVADAMVQYDSMSTTSYDRFLIGVTALIGGVHSSSSTSLDEASYPALHAELVASLFLVLLSPSSIFSRTSVHLASLYEHVPVAKNTTTPLALLIPVAVFPISSLEDHFAALSGTQASNAHVEQLSALQALSSNAFFRLSELLRESTAVVDVNILVLSILSCLASNSAFAREASAATLRPLIKLLNRCGAPKGIIQLVYSLAANAEGLVMDSTLVGSVIASLFGASDISDISTATAPALAVNDRVYLETALTEQMLAFIPASTSTKDSVNVPIVYATVVSNVLNILARIPIDSAKALVPCALQLLERVTSNESEESATTAISATIAQSTIVPLFIRCVMRLVKSLCAFVTHDTVLSSEKSFQTFMNALSKDHTLTVSSSTLLDISDVSVVTTTARISFSFRTFVLASITPSLFRVLSREQQQVVFDVLLSYTFNPSVARAASTASIAGMIDDEEDDDEEEDEDRVASDLSHLTPEERASISLMALSRPAVLSESVLNALYAIRLPSFLFASHIAPSKDSDIVQTIVIDSLSYVPACAALKLAMLTLSASNLRAIRHPLRLIEPLLALMRFSLAPEFDSKISIPMKSEESLASTELTAEGQLISQIPLRHNLQHQSLTVLFLIFSLSHERASQEASESPLALVSDSDLNCIAEVALRAMLPPAAPSSTSAEGNLHGTFISSTLEDPQRVQARDAALQVLSYAAQNAPEHTRAHIVRIVPSFVASISSEEAVARAANAPFPSLSSALMSSNATAVAVCDSTHVISGSLLDVCLRVFRSIVAPAVPSTHASAADLLRMVVDQALTLAPSSLQVLISGAIRAFTHTENDQMELQLYSAPLDTELEALVAAAVKPELIGEVIALILARVNVPTSFLLRDVVDNHVADARVSSLELDSGISSALIDVAQRVLMSYESYTQLSAMAHMFTLISSPIHNVPLPRVVRSSRGKKFLVEVETESVVTEAELEAEKIALAKQVFLPGTFAEKQNTSIVFAWRESMVQFLGDIASNPTFTTSVSQISRRTTRVFIYKDAITSDLSASDAESYLLLLSKSFSLLFSRIITCSILSDSLRSSHSSVSVQAHWRRVITLLDNFTSLLVSLLATVHFTNVFKTIFDYSLHPESPQSARFLALPYDDFENAPKLFTILRSVSVKKLLMLLIERVRIERERVHAEAFLHLVQNVNTGTNMSLRQMSDNSNHVEEEGDIDFDDDDDLDEYEADLIGLSGVERRDAKKKLWLRDLQRRHYAFMGVIPVLTTKLFYPFLSFYNVTLDTTVSKAKVGAYHGTSDLQNLQVAMLCIDELSDIACLYNAPLSSPATALASLSGAGHKQTLKLPKALVDSLLQVYTMTIKVGTVSASETFKLSQKIEGAVTSTVDDAWPLLLSSAMMCMATITARVGLQTLAFLKTLTPLCLAILDKTAFQFGQHEQESKRVELIEQIETKKVKSSEQHTLPLSRAHIELLQLSSLSVLDTLLRVFPAFLSSFLSHILAVLLHPALPERNALSVSDVRFLAVASLTINASAKPSDLSVNISSSANQASAAAGGIVSSCLNSLARYVSPRVLLPPVFSAWALAVSRGAVSTSRLLALVGLVCNTLVSVSADDEEDENEDENTNTEERSVTQYFMSLFQFFLSALNLRKEQADPEVETLSILAKGGQAAHSIVSVQGSNSFEWSVSDVVNSNAVDGIVNIRQTRALWSDAALLATEEALVSAFVVMILKLNEQQLRTMFTQLTEWVGVGDGEQATVSSISQDPVSKALPRALPYFRVICALVDSLKFIFLPYMLDIMNISIMFLAPPPKGSKHERKQLKDAAKSKKRSADDVIDEDQEEEDVDSASLFLRRSGTIFTWRALTSILVVKALYASLKIDTELANDHSGQTTAVFSKDCMSKLVPALVGHIDAAYATRQGISSSAAKADPMLIFPEFADALLIPCLGQVSVHLGRVNPAMWDTLSHLTLQQTRSSSALVRFAALSAVHEYFKLNKDDFLLLLPKIVPYISELMQDSNVVVEKLSQELIRTIENLSGESLQQYLR